MAPHPRAVPFSSIMVLKAVFNAYTPPFFFSEEKSGPLSLSFPKGEFSVELTLTLEPVPESSSYTSCKHFQVSVSRPDVPPPDMELDTPEADAARTKYLEERREDFISAGRDVINSFIQYLRTEKQCWELVPVPREEFSINNPVWTYGDLDVAHHGLFFSSTPMHIASEPIQKSDLEGLESYLQTPPPLTLSQSLLLDARRSLREGNLQRAVVELAIAAEIATKSAFFAESTPAAAAFNYMEDRRPSSPLKEWLSGVSREAFGEAFSDSHSDAARNLDHLMRCRNQVVHRGRLSFRDEENRITPDSETVLWWFRSVDILLGWLQEKKEAIHPPDPQ